MRNRDCMSFFTTLLMLGAVALPLPAAAAPKPREDTWRTSGAIVSRLGAEWYKMGVLRREIGSITDVLADLRNIELFPEEITGLGEKRLVAFDKRIDAIEKRLKEISGDVDGLRLPLSDAMAILREMVVDKPVEEMLEVLEKGDLERIDRMLSIKHALDATWKEVDSLTVGINAQMGFPPFETHDAEGLEKEFFDIIRANLGKQSEEYYNKMTSIKDSLVARCNEEQQKKAFAVEMHQINAYLKAHSWPVALQRVLSMKTRYTDEQALATVQAVLARAHFAMGEYVLSLAAADSIPEGTVHDTTKALCRIQSLYALHEYERIWEWGQGVAFDAFAGGERNLLIWLTMESGLALGVDTDYSKFAGSVAKEAPYHLHVMHSLARSYLVKGQIPTGLSVLQSALLLKPAHEADKKAYRLILLATAQALYEDGAYEKALKGFFELLDQEEDFEEALYGMAWCYVRLGRFEKAETTLRKLINQNPASPLAAEAILLMARRYVNKAQYEWKKISFLSKEHARLNELGKKLAAKIPPDSSGQKFDKYRAALAELHSVIATIESEPRAQHSEIASYYDKALDICTLVRSHYETGSFQEIAFSESREALLHVLDSLLLAVGAARENVAEKRYHQDIARKDLEKVKGLAKRSSMLSAEAHIDRYRWEREYIGWNKTALAATIRAVRTQCEQAADSAERALCDDRRRRHVAQMDSLLALEESMRQRWFDTLTTLCLRELTADLDSGDEIYLRYHLGELYYDKENETFAREHEEYEKQWTRYERQMALFRDAKLVEMPEKPTAPVLAHERSMRQYQTAIEKYPDHEEIAPVRYSLAWCFTDLGKFDSAVTQMGIVARAFPRCQFAPQAWMYLGENFFDAAQLDQAIEAYQSVMKYPESEWFDEALYKLAWAQYRKSNPGKAISSFLALVDLGEAQATGKALLEKESLDYIAISFSESDVTGQKGLEQAAMFVEKLGDADRGTQILHRLAGVYKEQGRMDMAKNTYQTLLQMYPDNKNSPMIESEFLSVRDKDMKLEESCQLKEAFFEKYNHDSKWAKAQRDVVAIKTADSLAANHLYDASVTYHQLALQNNDRGLYATAAENYEQYIKTYPRSPIANECHYNFAEIHFSLGSYQRAAEEYIAVSKRYPDSKYKETAAWNAIVASQNLLKQEEKVR